MMNQWHFVMLVSLEQRIVMRLQSIKKLHFILMTLPRWRLGLYGLIHRYYSILLMMGEYSMVDLTFVFYFITFNWFDDVKMRKFSTFVVVRHLFLLSSTHPQIDRLNTSYSAGFWWYTELARQPGCREDVPLRWQLHRGSQGLLQGEGLAKVWAEGWS